MNNTSELWTRCYADFKFCYYAQFSASTFMMLYCVHLLSACHVQVLFFSFSFVLTRHKQTPHKGLWSTEKIVLLQKKVKKNFVRTCGHTIFFCHRRLPGNLRSHTVSYTWFDLGFFVVGYMFQTHKIAIFHNTEMHFTGNK